MLLRGLKIFVDRMLGRDRVDPARGHDHHAGHESEFGHLGKRGKAHQATPEAIAHRAEDRAKRQRGRDERKKES